MPHHDLAVLGAGSGSSIIDSRFDDLDVAVVEQGRFGGTCLNVGCIPTKMYVHAAHVAETVRHAHRYGIDATVDKVRWPDIRERVFGRIDPISEAIREYRSLADGSVVTGDTLLVATGRKPNGDQFDLHLAGIPVHPDGRIVVDAHQRTPVDGIFAIGDVSSPFQLKHVANHEKRVVAHNLLHPDDLRKSDHRFVPSAVFTDPAVAAVGLTEQRCRAQGLDYTVAVQRYADVAYGWAMEDSTGFCKVIADRHTGRLLGAHVLGPGASSIIQPLVQAMSFGQDARDVARHQYWIHPALPEVVENALL